MSCSAQNQIPLQSIPNPSSQLYWCHICRIHKRIQVVGNLEMHCRNCHSPMEKIEENSQDRPENFNIFDRNSNYQQNNQNQQQNQQNRPRVMIFDFVPEFLFFPRIIPMTHIFFQRNAQQNQQMDEEGASKEKIESLEEQTMRNDHPEKLCSVCMEHFQKDEKIMLLPCKHTFHKDCVVEWLKRKNNCPCCRQKI